MKQTLLLPLAFALVAGAFLAAQPATPPAGAPSDPTPPSTLQASPGPTLPQDFEPVRNQPQAEQLPAAPLLMGAYAFVWVALIAYLWSLWKRMTKIDRELADLQRRVQSR